MSALPVPYLEYAKAAGEVGKALNGMMGGSGPAAPSSSDGNRYDMMFDSSGWSVNFGEGGITSSRTTDERTSESSGVDSLSMATVFAVVGLLLVVVAWKRKKSA